MTQPSLAFMTQQVAPSDNAMRTATVVAADPTQGTVEVSVGGTAVTLRCLAAGVRPGVGSTVALLRQEASWLVLGVVSGPDDRTLQETPWVEVPAADAAASWVAITAGSNPVIADGEIRMRYRQLFPYSTRYEVQMFLIGGPTTNWGVGIYGWVLPFTCTADSVLFSTGSGHVLNAATQEYVATCRLFSTTTVRMFWAGPGGGSSVATNSPVAFGGVPVGDEIRFNIVVDREV